MKIAVSILSSNYSDEETILKINETDADYLHIDVADGKFVPNKIRDYEGLNLSKKPMDVHLMVSSPFEYISKYASLGAKAITIHSELDLDIDSLLDYIHERGCKCGLALNPETPVSKLEHYIEKIDIVLIMSVHPGAGNQKFISDVASKIDELRSIRKNRGLDFEIFIDGGINPENIETVRGVDAVISGSFVCKSDDFQKRIDQLRL